jgi:MFS family permease
MIHRRINLLAGFPQELRSNFLHLFFDIGWWGIYMGSTVAFLPIYAARNGATPAQLGLLTAIPALVALIFSLPSGWVVRRMGAKPVTILSALASRLPLVLYALLPWLLPRESQVLGVLVVAAVIAVPTALIGVSFGQFFMEGVPSSWRGEVVGARIAIMSIISFVVTSAAGQILTHMTFPVGYQIVFLAGCIGASMTAYHISRVTRVHDPASRLQPGLLVPPQVPVKRRWLPALGSGLDYLRVISLLFVFNFTNNMFVPLVPDLLVNGLKLSDATISLGTAFANMLVFLVSLFIARLTRRTGNRRATAYGAMFLTLHALALAFARGELLYFVAVFVGGFGSGILGAAQYNYNLDNVPEQERSTWLAINFFSGNAAVLLGALAGPLVAQAAGNQTAFLLFGALRLLIGLVILRWG